MRYLKSLFLFAVVAVFTLSSCGKDASPLCSSEEFNQRVSAAAESYTAALNDFASDPENSEKCETFKSNYINYINELRALSECAVFLGRAEFQNDLDRAEDEFDDFEC